MPFVSADLSSLTQPNRNDTWVVPYNVSLLTGYALYRGAIRRERPAFHPLLRFSTNFLPFLSGSGREATAAKIPLDGILLGAAGICSTANGYIRICTNKKQGAKIPLLKVLEDS